MSDEHGLVWFKEQHAVAPLKYHSIHCYVQAERSKFVSAIDRQRSTLQTPNRQFHSTRLLHVSLLGGNGLAEAREVCTLHLGEAWR